MTQRKPVNLKDLIFDISEGNLTVDSVLYAVVTAMNDAEFNRHRGHLTKEECTQEWTKALDRRYEDGFGDEEEMARENELAWRRLLDGKEDLA